MAASWGRMFLAVLAITVVAYVQAAGEDNAFMPKGVRALLLDMLGASPDQTELRAIVQARRTEHI